MNSVTPIWPAVFLGMYLFLELLDWGLSLAAPFVARNQEENKAVLSLLKPGIDLKEAWLIFGLSLVASAVPAAAGDTMHDSVMAVLSVAVVGGALRILAAFFKNVFGSALIMKGMSLYSALALFVIRLRFLYSRVQFLTRLRQLSVVLRFSSSQLLPVLV